MTWLLDNREQVKELLLGVQLTCVFAFVGLICYAAGWVKSRQVHAPPIGWSGGGLVAEPVPGWAVDGLYLTLGVLLVAIALDVYLLVSDDDVDIKGWFQQLGEKS